MVVGVSGIGMVWCDFGRESEQNLDVRYEADPGRVRFRS